MAVQGNLNRHPSYNLRLWLERVTSDSPFAGVELRIREQNTRRGLWGSTQPPQGYHFFYFFYFWFLSWSFCLSFSLIFLLLLRHCRYVSMSYIIIIIVYYIIMVYILVYYIYYMVYTIWHIYLLYGIYSSLLYILVYYILVYYMIMVYI